MIKTLHQQTINILPFSKWGSIGQPSFFSQDEQHVHDMDNCIVSGDGFFREYNEFNQLVRIRNGTTVSVMLLEDYTYHPTQERVLIKHVYNNSGGLKETVYYISDEFVRVTNTTGTYDTVYVKVDGQLVAQKNPDGSKNFIHDDHLGSASVVTDEAGNSIENTSYSPDGDILTGGSKSRYSYTGQEFDSVIGDFDFNARRYKSVWGLFISPDKTTPQTYNPQSLNRYSYVLNKPYTYSDRNGMEPTQDWSGNAQDVVKYMENIEKNNPNLEADQVLIRVAATAPFYELSSHNEKSDPQFRPNFVYTEERGVIDQMHFFANAFASRELGVSDKVGETAGLLVEEAQLIYESASAFTYEDIVSNRAGREFGKSLNNQEKLSAQYSSFMTKIGASEFPKWLLTTMPKTYKDIKYPVESWKLSLGRGKSLPIGRRLGDNSFQTADGVVHSYEPRVCPVNSGSQ